MRTKAELDFKMRIRTQEPQIYMPPKARAGQGLNMHHFKNFENL